MRNLLHVVIVGVIISILKEVGVPDASVVMEARELRAAGRSRPSDAVALDFFAHGRHLIIDEVVTTVYKNIVLQKVASIPGCATKQAEDRKLLADRTSSHPIATPRGGPRVLVPFAMEDGGRHGAHAHALLRALAVTALAKGRSPSAARKQEDALYGMAVSLRVHQWQHRLSTWLQLALSSQVIRLLSPATSSGMQYI
jgi:hypothetical protein